MKQQYVQTLAAGDSVNDVFVVSEKNMARKKNGDPFLTFVFSDKTGEMRGVAWDAVEEISAAADAGTFAAVRGTVTEYRGNLQMTVTEITGCSSESVDPADFLPVTPRDPDKMLERLKSFLTETIRDPHLHALLDAFWADAAFVDALKRAPAAKRMHHAYIGGLLEHTLSMTLLVHEIAKHYSGIDTDILLMGVLLHDIGKTKEFDYAYFIDYSDFGKLVTHIVIGCEILAEKIREIPDFPKELEMLLKHMIVSHHGTREFGSPEPPRTLEAVLLSHIDDLDAKMNGLREFIRKDDSGSSWSGYNPMLGRHLYKGRRIDGDG